MEHGENGWSTAEQMKRALCWEAKKLFHRLYVPAGIFLGALLLIGLLPKAACDFLRTHAFIAVAFVNMGFVAAVMLGMVQPAVILLTHYADRLYPMERTGDLSDKAGLLARLALGVPLLAAVILSGHLASALMEKFADGSVSWLHWNYTLGFGKMLICGGLVQPLAALWIFLRRLGRHREYQYIMSFILSLLLSEVIKAAAELQFLHFAPGKEPAAWIMDGIWYLVMLGSAGIFFRLSLNNLRVIFGSEV